MIICHWVFSLSSIPIYPNKIMQMFESPVYRLFFGSQTQWARQCSEDIFFFFVEKTLNRTDRRKIRVCVHFLWWYMILIYEPECKFECQFGWQTSSSPKELKTILKQIFKLLLAMCVSLKTILNFRVPKFHAFSYSHDSRTYANLAAFQLFWTSRAWIHSIRFGRSRWLS